MKVTLENEEGMIVSLEIKTDCMFKTISKLVKMIGEEDVFIDVLEDVLGNPFRDRAYGDGAEDTLEAVQADLREAGYYLEDGELKELPKFTLPSDVVDVPDYINVSAEEYERGRHAIWPDRHEERRLALAKPEELVKTFESEGSDGMGEPRCTSEPEGNSSTPENPWSRY